MEARNPGCDVVESAGYFPILHEYLLLSIEIHLRDLQLNITPVILEGLGNKKSDMSSCDLYDWDGRNDLE